MKNEKNEKNEELLMIKPAPISLLPHLQSRVGTGKYGKFFKRLLAICANWPEDKLMTIPSGKMREDKKERVAFIAATNKFMQNNTLPFRARWSSMEQVIFIYRHGKTNGKQK